MTEGVTELMIVVVEFAMSDLWKGVSESEGFAGLMTVAVEFVMLDPGEGVAELTVVVELSP